MRLLTRTLLAAYLLSIAAGSALCGVISDNAETRETRSRLVPKTGYSPSQGVFAISNRYANFVTRLLANGWTRGAFPPVNAMYDLSVTFSPAPASESYAIEPFIVERTYTWSSGLTGYSHWFSSPDSALMVGLFHLRNNGSQSVQLRVQQSGVFRVGYADASQARPANIGYAGSTPQEIRIVNATYTDLFCKLRSGFPGSPVVINTDTNQPVAEGTPGMLGYSQDGTITLAPGAQGDYWIALTGGRTGEMEFAFEPTTASLTSALAATQAWQAERIDHAPTLETPDEDLNAFFLWNKVWPWRTEHDLPLGSPYLISSRDNARVRVLSAATGLNWDYYGIWANDCVQSLWECGALGHEYYPIIAGTLEANFRHGSPESIELPLADGKPFYVFLKLASKPEFVMGAANYLLWSGDQAEFDRVWPEIRLTLQAFHAENDWDRDWLDDNCAWPFPEQPSVGSYNHEMLYASCYWYEGFDAAARAARLFGHTAEAADLEWQRDQIGAAINAKLATDWGYASWLDASHQKHPHKGHNQVFTVQYGIAPAAQAEKVFENQLSAPIITDYGPLVGDMGVGSIAWVYNRWNMVHALYNYGHADQAYQWIQKFVGQESNSAVHYQGPEAYGATGGTTTQGLVWSSCRAMRALYFGLIGICLEGDGVRFRPNPPTAWPSFQLNNLEVRGAAIDLSVVRGSAYQSTCDGQPIADGLVPNSMLTPGTHSVVITLPSSYATISGKVTSKTTGGPLEGATIQVVGDVTRSTTTNASGDYSILVPSGTCTLSASLAGYRTTTRVMTATSGQTLTDVDFQLTSGTLTYHVSTTGSDSNDALTLATAWATIDKGDRDGLLRAADTVLVEAGTYDMSGAERALVSAGTAANPIVYRANGQVILSRGANAGTVLRAVAPAQNIVLEGFHLTGGSCGFYMNGVSGVELRNCWLSDRTGGGNLPALWMVGCSNLRIHHNVIGPNLPAYTHGIVDDSSGGYNRIYNNTIVDSTDWAYVLGGAATGATGNEVKNNIIYGANCGLFSIDATLSHSNNILYGVTGSAYSGLSADASESAVDPMLLNPSARDYHLQIGSPAIDAGVNVGLSFNGTAPDLGAFETGAAVSADAVSRLLSQPDGTLVSLTGTVVTAGSGAFAGNVICVEDENRVAGITVISTTSLPVVVEGQRVSVSGTMVTVNGARAICAAAIAGAN